MSYVRGEPAAPVDYPKLLVGRLGGCINVRRSRRRKRKRNTKKSNNNFDNEAMDRQRERRKCAKGAERQLGGDRWKKKEETEK